MTGHTLIAGVTGSGKSYCEHKFIEKAMDSGAEIVLLDPKLVELRDYKDSALLYADDIHDITYALEEQCWEMEDRYNSMIDRGLKKWDGADRFIFLDETADLMAQSKKDATKVLQRLSMLGRAAGIWLVLCTQRGTADVIPRSIVINLDNIVCLRQAKPVDSQQLIGRSGAERLPRIGYAYLKTPDFPMPMKLSTDDVVNMLWKGV